MNLLPKKQKQTIADHNYNFNYGFFFLHFYFSALILQFIYKILIIIKKINNL